MTLTEARHLLGLGSQFSVGDIDAQFRARAQQSHPDVGGNAGEFRRLMEARDRARMSVVDARPSPETHGAHRSSASTSQPVTVINTDAWLERQWKKLVARLTKRTPRNLK